MVELDMDKRKSKLLTHYQWLEAPCPQNMDSKQSENLGSDFHFLPQAYYLSSMGNCIVAHECPHQWSELNTTLGVSGRPTKRMLETVVEDTTMPNPTTEHEKPTLPMKLKCYTMPTRHL
jgi:hypothetical protein